MLKYACNPSEFCYFTTFPVSYVNIIRKQDTNRIRFRCKFIVVCRVRSGRIVRDFLFLFRKSPDSSLGSDAVSCFFFLVHRKFNFHSWHQLKCNCYLVANSGMLGWDRHIIEMQRELKELEDGNASLWTWNEYQTFFFCFFA